MIDALEYCHEKKVIHRDIKPENILLGYYGELKIADFGWSVHAPSSRFVSKITNATLFYPCYVIAPFRRATMCGTLDYLPPEMVLHQSYSDRVDHWCLGVLTYEFLVGKPPFECEDQNITYRRIVSVQFSYPDYVHPLAQEFVNAVSFFMLIRISYKYMI